MARILIVIAILMLIYAVGARIFNLPLVIGRNMISILGAVLFAAGLLLTVIQRRR